jgi:signal transduction histidine kinase
VSRLSVRWRLTLAFAAVMACVLAATGLFVSQRIESNLDSAIDASLRAQASALATLAQQSDTGLAEARNTRVGGDQLQVAQLIDSRGRVIDATAGSPPRPLLAPSVLARAGPSGVIANRTLPGGEPVRLLAVPIRAQSQRLIAVVGQSLEERNRAIGDLTNVLLIGGPVALLLSSLAGYLMAGAALRPVEAMRRRERAFIADASHELRSPLAMLRTELELMARDRPSGAEFEAATASAIEETERLGRLADDLLLLSRADQHQLQLARTTLPPAELLEAAAARARRRARPDLTVELDDSDGLPPVLADRSRVGQAIDNLLDNALRHAATEVQLTARVNGSSVELHVLDDGPGFAPEFLPHAWERFSRADSARTEDGAGLGLSIVSAIAAGHGGRVGAANRPQRGADVWISLPVAADAPVAPRQADAADVGPGR